MLPLEANILKIMGGNLISFKISLFSDEYFFANTSIWVISILPSVSLNKFLSIASLIKVAISSFAVVFITSLNSYQFILSSAFLIIVLKISILSREERDYPNRYRKKDFDTDVFSSMYIDGNYTDFPKKSPLIDYVYK